MDGNLGIRLDSDIYFPMILSSEHIPVDVATATCLYPSSLHINVLYSRPCIYMGWGSKGHQTDDLGVMSDALRVKFVSKEIGSGTRCRV